MMCDVLEVSRNGFYAWRKRPKSARAARHCELLAEIKTIHGDRDMKCYGSPRMCEELVARGKACSENTVAKRWRS